MDTREGLVVLRCYAERDDDSWFAICLDLNIYARGDTFDAARVDLMNQTKQYIQEAVTVDYEHFHDLIPRRAPARFWLKYGWVVVCAFCDKIASDHAKTISAARFNITEKIPRLAY